MRKLLCISLSVAALAMHSVAAKALPMSVSYSLAGVASTIVGPISNLTGTLDVLYGNATGVLSSSTGMVFHGPAMITGGTLMAPLDFTVFGAAAFMGSLSGPFGVVGGGALHSGTGKLQLPFTAMLTGTIHCAGPGCTGFGFPASMTAPITLSPNNVFNAPGVGAVSGLLLGVFAFQPVSIGAFQGFPIIANITATEVSRHVVPEPSTLPLLAIGLGALGIVGRRVMRRR